MRIGAPREVKADEHRVALTPSGTDELVRAGHEVWVEADAGAGAGFSDEAYERVGARVVDANEAWSCELVVKVKEPQPAEFAFLRRDLTLFTYLHLAANPPVARALADSGATAIAYETVQDARGRLPLLAPMSEIAGRLAVQSGARFLEKPLGGSGVLLGGVAGVSPGSVVVLGGGNVGVNAALVAAGMQAHVAIVDVSVDRLRELEMQLAGRVTLIHSSRLAIEELVEAADLVVGAVLVPGARAPVLVDRGLLRRMRPGSVVVDVAVDQGGCIETARPTTHSDPVYVEEGVQHYCVANMPGAVPITATRGLCNSTIPYVLALASGGIGPTLRAREDLASGVNVRAGEIVNAAVAQALRS